MGPSHCVCLLIALSSCYHRCAADNDELQVSTAKGVLQGHHLTSRAGRQFLAFQGIPYGKPPVAQLRFKPLLPAEPWTGVLNATRDPPMCVQRNIFIGSTKVEGQEDCIYLNIYTPQLPEKEGATRLRPVMVWIHGGGWLSGTGSSLLYNPAFLMDKDVLVVAFNYRLGPLGFLSTGDKVVPGNNGLKDQVMALRWVRDNIAAFGGDPNSVTIFGESAGAASVHYHVISPMSRGLFHRAISMSGSAFCPWAFAPGGSSRHQTLKLATLLGCPTDSSSSIVACLEKKDAADIIATDKAFTEWGLHPLIPFMPVVEPELAEGEEAFLTKEPRVAVAQKDISSAPWMTGYTSEDGAFFIANVFQNEKSLKDLIDDFDRVIPMSLYYRNTSNSVDEINQKLRKFYFGNRPIDKNAVHEVVNLFTDGFFAAAQDEAVKAHTAAGVGPVYYYVFNYRGTRTFTFFPGDAVGTDYGVSHVDDLLYLFPFDHIFPRTKTSEDDEKVIDILTTLWTNYARYGDPTPSVTKLLPELWPPATNSANNYYHIRSNVYASSDPLKKRVTFWASLPIRDKTSASFRDEL